MLDRFRPLDQRHPPRVVSDGRSLLLDSEMAGDEPFMLASNLKDVLVLVDKDRVKSGLHAIRKFGCDTLLLDDGLQFLRLKERIDIVLVDSESPFANRHLLPRGLLREPPEQLRRANIIFITKCDGRDLTELRDRIAPLQQPRRVRRVRAQAAAPRGNLHPRGRAALLPEGPARRDDLGHRASRKASRRACASSAWS